MRKLFLLLILLHCIAAGFAQDTVRIMTYNLLYYNHYSQTYCTQTNNPIADKDEYLKTIIAHTLPDIVCFNEVYASDATRIRLKGSVLNSGGRNWYTEASYPYGSGSLTSFLFYNQDKFDKSLTEVTYVNTGSVRDMMIYKLRLKNSNPPVDVYVIPAHLKAGSYSSDQADRLKMIDSLMSKIDQRGNNDNFILLGDLNFYSHTESGFQRLINHPNNEYRFYDPINQIGEWNENYSFRCYHTQSTQSSGDGCKASGGLDDRFDFILVDDDIITGASQVQYIPNSYTTLGNDCNHFNQSLNYGGNNSVPPDVLDALFNMSDHLPVYADFRFGHQNSISNYSQHNMQMQFNNPAGDVLHLKLSTVSATETAIMITDIHGKPIYETRYFCTGIMQIDIPLNELQQGVYLVIAKTDDRVISQKLVKL